MFTHIFFILKETRKIRFCCYANMCIYFFKIQRKIHSAKIVFMLLHVFTKRMYMSLFSYFRTFYVFVRVRVSSHALEFYFFFFRASGKDGKPTKFAMNRKFLYTCFPLLYCTTWPLIVRKVDRTLLNIAIY